MGSEDDDEGIIIINDRDDDFWLLHLFYLSICLVLFYRYLIRLFVIQVESPHVLNRG
jgi:hypothetical protein